MFMSTSTFVMAAGNINASNTSDLVNQQYVEMAKDLVENHIRNRDTGVAYVDAMCATEVVNEYLKTKGSIKIAESKQKGIERKNYEIETSLKDYNVDGDKTHLIITVRVSFNYVDGIDSGYAKPVDVLIDNNTHKIVDIYERSNGFDSVVRGGDFNILNELTRLSEADVIKSMQRYTPFEVENDVVNTSNKEDVNSKMATNSYTWIDLDAVARYANNNYYKNQPSSGGSGVSYIDFYNPDNGSYDCTNFVSHALLAGGASVYDTGGSGISSTGWYCRSSGNRSSSWTGVTNLYSFTTNNTTKGPGGYSTSYSDPETDEWAVGDIMQFKFDGSWGHSTVIGGIIFYENGTHSPLVTGRTGDDWYNYQELPEDVNGSQSKRVLHLYNWG